MVRAMQGKIVALVQPESQGEGFTNGMALLKGVSHGKCMGKILGDATQKDGVWPDKSTMDFCYGIFSADRHGNAARMRNKIPYGCPRPSRRVVIIRGMPHLRFAQAERTAW